MNEPSLGFLMQCQRVRLENLIWCSMFAAWDVFEASKCYGNKHAAGVAANDSAERDMLVVVAQP